MFQKYFYLIAGALLLHAPARSQCTDSCNWGLSGNNIRSGYNIFGTLTGDDIRIQTSATDRGIITKEGLLGWNTSTPTAYLHVNAAGHNENNGLSDVRFEGLEVGDGNVMVINNTGYVMDSKIPLKYFADLLIELEDAKERYNKLEQEVSEMRLQLKAVLEGNDVNGGNGNAQLFQNSPNPFDRATVIGYTIKHIQSEAYLAVYNVTGKEIVRYPILKEGNSGTVINAERWAAGVYLYSLVVDGVNIDTKKMVYKK